MQKETASIKKMSVFALTWPIFIETLLRTMLGNVDTFMLSTYSDDAVGGSRGCKSNKLYTYHAVQRCFVRNTGAYIPVSGAKKKKEASVVAVTSIAGSLIFVCLSDWLYFCSEADINIS